MDKISTFTQINGKKGKRVHRKEQSFAEKRSDSGWYKRWS
jgi:hypothetical protein